MTYKGAVYYRSGSTTQILNGSALERFIVQHVVDANWDEQVLTEFKSADLDIKAIDDFREKAIVRGRLTENARQDSPEQLCAKLGLMRDNHYTNAAVLLFAANSERWLVGSYTKIAFFRSQAGILYHHEVYGPLLAQVDKTVEVLTSLYLKGIVDYVGLERRERYFVPQAALRESIINALCHNRYQSRNPVQIRVTEETLTVDNNGSLPFGWTLDRLLGEHRSQPSNPLLARMFFTAGYIEAYGQGIGRIFESCAQAGAPSSVHKRAQLCAHTGGFQALCTHRRIPSSVHTQEDSKLCAHTGGLLLKNRVFELSNCTSLISSGFYIFQTYSR